MAKIPGRNRVVPWVVLTLTLLILGAGITLLTRHLREVIREQILQQDGEVLYAGYLIEQFNQQQLAADLKAALGPEEEELAEDLNALFGKEEQLLSIVSASKLRGVIAVRLYDESGGTITSFPESTVRAGSLAAVDLDQLKTRTPQTQFLPEGNLLDFLEPSTFDGPPPRTPLIRVLVPLHDESNFVGAAEFFLEGRNVAAAFAVLDQDLWRYASLIFLVGGAILTAVLGWAFHRLQASNELLRARTQSLLRANHELTMAAKTSALGAITAHLIHDLKSPLFGLQNFVSSRGHGGAPDDEDWSLALDTTRRMQKIVSDVVKILQEEKGAAHYEMSVKELFNILSGKLAAAIKEKNITFHTEASVDPILSNKNGNIVLLIATNVLQNAVQATPEGGRVGVKVYQDDQHLCVDLFDTGPGLPDHILETLFTPSRSTKSGGTGLGLAISKQLATHLGAELLLIKSSPEGTTFQLRIPESILNPPEFALP